MTFTAIVLFCPTLLMHPPDCNVLFTEPKGSYREIVAFVDEFKASLYEPRLVRMVEYVSKE